MPRQWRIEYPGAIYHLMNRGDRREPVFKDDADRQRFVSTLAEARQKTDWQIHAYCLMLNLSRPAKRVVRFYNQRGTTEQWIKEGKNAVKWTRLSCHDFVDNQVQLQLFVLASTWATFRGRRCCPKR